MATSAMKSTPTPRFWALFYALPIETQRLAIKNYHPSLRFRPLAGNSKSFTIRVGDHDSALGYLERDTVWIRTP